jgi:hypothetical protein
LIYLLKMVIFHRFLCQRLPFGAEKSYDSW